MDTCQRKVFLQTRLRNLRRKYVRISEVEYTTELIEIGNEIESIEKELGI